MLGPGEQQRAVVVQVVVAEPPEASGARLGWQEEAGGLVEVERVAPKLGTVEEAVADPQDMRAAHQEPMVRSEMPEVRMGGVGPPWEANIPSASGI